ncbi:MAG: nitroreductase family protein [Owenweeksia sp.]
MSKVTEGFINYEHRKVEDPQKAADEFYRNMDQRRSVRDFTDEPVSREVIERLIQTASTAPSGAHKQPWTFVAVSDPALKKQIREAAEKEEYEFYHGRATQEWLDDLAPIGTDWHKPFLETAPWLIVVFKKSYNNEGEGKSKNYYVQESVGIACGFLIAAIHQAGLVTLTHTPSPMNFLADILKRPANEKPFLLLPVGYPDSNATVPDLKRKPLGEVSIFI